MPLHTVSRSSCRALSAVNRDAGTDAVWGLGFTVYRIGFSAFSGPRDIWGLETDYEEATSGLKNVCLQKHTYRIHGDQLSSACVVSGLWFRVGVNRTSGPFSTGHTEHSV